MEQQPRARAATTNGIVDAERNRTKEREDDLAEQAPRFDFDPDQKRAGDAGECRFLENRRDGAAKERRNNGAGGERGRVLASRRGGE